MRPTILPLVIVSLILTSCNFKKKTSDLETNRYWVEYVRIYKDYNHVSLDSTKHALEIYLKEFPNDSRAWNFLGSVLDRINDPNTLEAYTKAITLDTNMAANYSSLASWYGRSGDLEKAENLMEVAIEKGDSSTFTKVNLALTLAKQKKKAACIELLQKLPDSDSLPANLQFSVAYSYYQIGEKQNAKQFLSKSRTKIEIADSIVEAVFKNEQSIDVILTQLQKQ